MTPFVKVPVDARWSAVYRETLLAQPDEFFQSFCGGRTPTPVEKLHAVEMGVQRMSCANIFENDIYHVEITVKEPFFHLDIRRLDGQPCKSWRDFQQIKNEIVGPEHEAVELFPAESRLVDTANQYHLWVHMTPDHFPFGFSDRFVLSEPLRYEAPGADGTLPTKPRVLAMDSAGMAVADSQ